MTPEAWPIFWGFLWMFGVPLLVWFLKDLQVERTRKKYMDRWDDAERRGNRSLGVAIHYQRALQMIASREVDAGEIALDALNAAEPKKEAS